MSMQPVRRTLLRDEAYREIRDAIVAGTLAPGEILRDADLAERLGLSRAPVREALARLVAEGLVESKPQSYTRVTRLDLRDIRDAVVVVSAMHELAVRVAVPILQQRDVLAMREANARFAAAVRRGDVEEALAADDALHDVLVTVCANRAVAETIERETPRIRRLERRKFATLSGQRSVHLHEELIAACAAGDVEAAIAVTGAIWSALLDVLAQEADAPSPADDLPRRLPRRSRPSRRAARGSLATNRSTTPSDPPAVTEDLAGTADRAGTADPSTSVDPTPPDDPAGTFDSAPSDDSTRPADPTRLTDPARPADPSSLT